MSFQLRQEAPNASLAKLVRQFFCKEQIGDSSSPRGSIFIIRGWLYRKNGRDATVEYIKIAVAENVDA